VTLLNLIKCHVIKVHGVHAGNMRNAGHWDDVRSCSCEAFRNCKVERAVPGGAHHIARHYGMITHAARRPTAVKQDVEEMICGGQCADKSCERHIC
jgi:hypothetical protein